MINIHSFVKGILVDINDVAFNYALVSEIRDCWPLYAQSEERFIDIGQSEVELNTDTVDPIMVCFNRKILTYAKIGNLNAITPNWRSAENGPVRNWLYGEDQPDKVIRIYPPSDVQGTLQVIKYSIPESSFALWVDVYLALKVLKRLSSIDYRRSQTPTSEAADVILGMFLKDITSGRR